MDDEIDVDGDIPSIPPKFREVSLTNSMTSVTIRSTFDKENIEYLAGKALFMVLLCENETLKDLWIEGLKKEMNTNKEQDEKTV